jgi:hypothetical protein
MNERATRQTTAVERELSVKTTPESPPRLVPRQPNFERFIKTV